MTQMTREERAVSGGSAYLEACYLLRHFLESAVAPRMLMRS